MISIASQKIELIQARAEDSLDLWKWRNDKTTREMSLNQQEINWDAHAAWFDAVQRDPNRTLYIAIDSNGEKLGVCRFDFETMAASAEVSINLNPLVRGKGLSQVVLGTAIDRYWRDEKKVRLIATIRTNNDASIKCFQGVGFKKKESQEFDILKFFLDP